MREPLGGVQLGVPTGEPPVVPIVLVEPLPEPLPVPLAGHHQPTHHAYRTPSTEADKKILGIGGRASFGKTVRP